MNNLVKRAVFQLVIMREMKESVFRGERSAGVTNSSHFNLRFLLDAAPVFTDLPRVLEVKENNQRGQIIKNIYGQARSRWNQNASIKYTIIKGKLVV